MEAFAPWLRSGVRLRIANLIPLRLKLIYIHKNKVYSMFPSNFIREIKNWYSVVHTPVQRFERLDIISKMIIT